MNINKVFKNKLSEFLLVIFSILFLFYYFVFINNLAFADTLVSCDPGILSGAALNCGPRTTESSGACSTYSTGPGLITQCEYCDYEYTIATQYRNCLYINSNGQYYTQPVSESVPGAVCTKNVDPGSCSPRQVNGCMSNADCPHPPDIVCDTYCTGTNGSCVQVDPTCNSGGGGIGICGDNICGGGETSATCPGDCPPSSNDFALSVTPSTNTIQPGGSASYTVTASNVGTFVGHVNVSVINCPTNAICSITASILRAPDYEESDLDLSYGPQTATLWVTNTSNTPINDYAVTVRGTSGVKVHDISPNLHVIPGVPPSFNASSAGSCPSKTISLTWTAGTGANAYRIYRNTSNSQPVTPLAVTGNATSYTDSPATGFTYYYWIESLHNPTGNYSGSRAASPINFTACPPVVYLTGWGGSVPQSAPVDGPISVLANTSGGLVWNSTGATNCEIFRGATSLGSAWSASSTAPLGGVTTSDTHSIVCYGPGGTSNTDSFTRNIIPVPTVSMTGWGDTVPQSAPVDGPITAAANTSGGLVWTTTNATSCQIWRGSTDLGSGFAVGTNITAPLGGVTASDTHTIVCYGPGGTSNTDSFTRNIVGIPVVDLRINGSTNPPTISHGTAATVSWTTTNATACSFSAGTGSGSWSGTSGSQTTPLLTADNTTYTIVCTGPSGSDTKSVTVRIPPAPTNPTGSCPTPGKNATISWNLPSGYSYSLIRAYDTAQAWSCGVNQLCTAGYAGSSYAFSTSTWPAMVPGHSYGWWVHAYDNVSGAYSNSVGGGFTCINAVPTADLKGWGDTVPQSSPVDGPITAAANTVGGLVWSSTNANDCELFRGSTSLGTGWPTSGTAPLGGVTSSDTHSIICYGDGGTSLQDSFTRNIIPVPTVDLKINNSNNPPTISYTGTATVSWTTTNATACSFSAGTGSGSWSGTSGSQTTPSLTADNTTYTISCSGPSGTATDSVTVRIPPAPTNPIGTCPSPGTSGTISWTLPSGYTQALVRAYDTAQTWTCGVNQLCTGGYTGSSYSLNGATWPAMVAGHNYGWWVHTYDSVSGANSNSVGGSFTCTVASQAAFSISPTTMSFSSTAGVAPSQQILTTTNTGTATLNYTVTTNQSWCRVNGVNNSGNVVGSIGSPPSGQTQNVAISVDGIATAGTYNCVVTFSDPAASAPTSRTLSVTYVVSANPLQAICDGAWHGVPNLGSLSQPVGSWVPDSPNIQKKNANIVVVRGGDNGVYYQFCDNALGNPCVWDATYTSLGGSTTYPANTEVPTFWNVFHFGNDNNTYLKYNSTSGWLGSWSNQGSTSRSWGQPFRWLDAPTNRTWQVRKNSDTSVSYYCSAPGGGGVCQPLNFVASRSSISAGSVSAGGAFTARCDYDSSGIDAITATVTGGGSCTWSSFDKTTAVFNCTAGATLGNQTVTCNLGAGANTSNVCAQGNTLGTINVTAAPVPSFTLNPTTMSFAGSTGGAAPSGQVLQIVSSGTSDVWYTATSNQSWCKINGATSQPGAVGWNPPGNFTPVMITVDAPSTVGVGTHSCTISVVDPTASPTTRTLAITYTVTSGTPTGKIIGKVCKDDNANGVCDTGSGEVYIRDTTLGACANPSNPYSGFSVTYGGAQGGSVIIDTCGGLGDPIFSANALANGSYTVTLNLPSGWGYTGCQYSSGGAYVNCSSFVAGSPVISSGETQVVLFYARQVGGAGPATVSMDNSTCGQMTINWSAVASATSYNVYRNTTGSAPVAGDLVQSGLTSLTYTNTVSAGSYYYWVSAIVGGSETTKVAPNSGVNTNPTAVNACGQANLNTSDKDFVGINGTSYASNNCGGTDPLANGISLKLNDKITFQINLCNDSGTGDATNVVVTDTLTNLKMPTGYSNFNAVYNGVAVIYDGAVGGSSCTPSGNNHYCAYGTVPNQTLVFNLTSSGNKVPAGLRRNLTFEAQLAVPSGYAQPSARFQNSFIINYNKGATPAVTPISSTPLILFSTGVGVPTIKEIP